jgi:hypothetical protein
MSNAGKEQQFPLGNYCDADERVTKISAPAPLRVSKHIGPGTLKREGRTG